MDTSHDNHEYALLWKKYFNRKPFGNCMMCNNSIRVTIDISRILKINNYKNMKYPTVCWKNNIYPLCYICNTVLNGNTQDELRESYLINQRQIQMNNYENNYLKSWYNQNGYCNYGNSKYSLCGNKILHDDGLCMKHYNVLNTRSIAKKGKFTS